jgi:hypothetical protein
MEDKQKTGWGSPSDWGTAIGALIAVVGLLSLISFVGAQDTVNSAAVGPLKSWGILPSVIILVVGLVIAGASQLFLKRKV